MGTVGERAAGEEALSQEFLNPQMAHWVLKSIHCGPWLKIDVDL